MVHEVMDGVISAAESGELTFHKLPSPSLRGKHGGKTPNNARWLVVDVDLIVVGDGATHQTMSCCTWAQTLTHGVWRV